MTGFLKNIRDEISRIEDTINAAGKETKALKAELDELVRLRKQEFEESERIENDRILLKG